MNLTFHPNEPPIKLAKKLHKKKEAEEYQLCLVEGWKCTAEAQTTQEALAVFICEGKHAPYSINFKGPIYYLEEKTFRSICSTQSPEGIAAIYQRPKINFSFPEPLQNKIHLILYEWRDPSNLGAVVRSARGFGVQSITLWGSGPDFFSPKVIRSSMGSVFHLNLHKIKKEHKLPEKLQLYLAEASGKSIEKLRLTPKESPFILIGSESHGWPDNLNEIGHSFSLPLENQLESLSAPIAASISLYAFRELLKKQVNL